VLDEAYMQRFTDRHSRWPDWNRPELWAVLIEPDRSAKRQWLAETIAGLDDERQAAVLRRLESSRSFPPDTTS
jgi:hypothetical protein